MPSFPYIQAFVRRGKLVAALAALAVFLLGAYAAWRLAAPDLAVIGLLLAAVAYAGTRLLAEIVLAIAETLLPR